MKIALASDVHLEFGHLEIENKDNADVLVLSGDICVASKFGPKEDRFFQDASKKFKNVVYLMGNHEHYSGDFAESEKTLRAVLARYDNIHFLEKNCVKIGDVTFIGGTLWTNMNNRDDMTMFHVSRRMNDFQCVRNSNRMVTRTVPLYELNPNYTEDGKNGGKYAIKEGGGLIEIGSKKKQEPSHFSPQDAADDFDKMYGYIQSVIEGRFDDKFVVCTHHAPSKGSEHPRYQHDTLMNGAYNSVLDEYILDHPQIKLWTHGHTHEDFDYMIGTTRVVCNPRGYINYESRADRFKLKILEV
jgi:predicted phosphodiesterase